MLKSLSLRQSHNDSIHMQLHGSPAIVKLLVQGYLVFLAEVDMQDGMGEKDGHREVLTLELQSGTQWPWGCGAETQVKMQYQPSACRNIRERKLTQQHHREEQESRLHRLCAEHAKRTGACRALGLPSMVP